MRYLKDIPAGQPFKTVLTERSGVVLEHNAGSTTVKWDGKTTRQIGDVSFDVPNRGVQISFMTEVE